MTSLIIRYCGVSVEYLVNSSPGLRTWEKNAVQSIELANSAVDGTNILDLRIILKLVLELLELYKN